MIGRGTPETPGEQGQQGQQGSQTRTRPLTGTVKSVDNGVLTITAQQGDEKVNLGSAKIEKMYKTEEPKAPAAPAAPEKM